MIPVFYEGEGYRWVTEILFTDFLSLSVFWKWTEWIASILFNSFEAGKKAIKFLFIPSYIVIIREIVLRPFYFDGKNAAWIYFTFY